MRVLIAIALLSAGLCGGAHAEPPADPLGSPMWGEMVRRLLADGPIQFDDRVKVQVPNVVEDQAQVPVTVDARGLPSVKKLVVFADLNPIQHVLTLTPADAAPFVAFRMKIEQGTPVRAAALDDQGVWHVGGRYLDAAGGGCSAPALARQGESWSDHVGEQQGRLWRDASGMVRVRYRIRHPMDTGLARDNTPAYFVERLAFKDTKGSTLAVLETFEPVSENPMLTLLVGLAPAEPQLEVEGEDTNGLKYRTQIPAPWRASAVPGATRQAAIAR